MTRSKGNIIYEIDGKPAMEVFGEYIPEGALTTIATGSVTSYRFRCVSEPLAT